MTGSELTFRVHCAEGEMDFATYHCSSVMRLFAGGRVVGRRTFKAVDDQERTLHFPRTSRLDRAIRRNTPIRIELTGFRDVESDFGTDHGGTLVWRITL